MMDLRCPVCRLYLCRIGVGEKVRLEIKCRRCKNVVELEGEAVTWRPSNPQRRVDRGQDLSRFSA